MLLHVTNVETESNGKVLPGKLHDPTANLKVSLYLYLYIELNSGYMYQNSTHDMLQDFRTHTHTV